ncbi:MAG: dienelactone hydrolase family protein [Alphaproteobacteria bacterium]|uniref:Dienelactone hydrolase family protein n=1 Tax=Candidatus Nitrobium versatile TaxID=2884831 RepID=A0A953JBX4_9BACT|nr:dienelactone hydrolase family protein [Candidatus Nitrobium versatile]
MYYLFFFTAFILLLPRLASAEIRTEVIEYKQDGTVLEGYLAYDTTMKGKRPGVLVIHEWVGINDYIRKRTEQLAKLGYVAFAADIYGKGVRPKDPKEAAAQAKIHKSDRALMRARAMAGLEVLKKQQLTDSKRLAAIGYCFGGTAALELARSGADIAGVVSFHGGLDTPSPADARNIKAKILALHGSEDPVVPLKEVLAFQDEMRSAGVDWQMILYGGALHSFTNPASGNKRDRGVAYDQKADRRSWEAMMLFFKEIFH